MKSLQQYHIPFTGLKLGKHQFEFDVTDAFFDEFDYSIVKKGSLHVDLELDKQETMILLWFHIKGEIMLSCDVCLSDFPSKIDVQERQIVKFNDEDTDEDTDEIMILSRNDHEVDVSGLIYEYINLAVPFIKRCEDAGQQCDPEMVERLEKLSHKEENSDNTDVDPRWEALKNINK